MHFYLHWPNARESYCPELEEKLYNYESLIGSNAIEVHIHHLRKKLSEDSIKTVRGVGYVLET